MHKIFIDLDETLFHSYYAGGAPSADNHSYIDPKTGLHRADVNVTGELYRSILRPYAVEFVQTLQTKFGVENVNILTASTRPYALALIEQFRIPVEPSRVFSRETMQYQLEPHREYKATLIDNLPERENVDKMNFLYRSEFISVNYITVLEFYGNHNDRDLQYILEQNFSDNP